MFNVTAKDAFYTDAETDADADADADADDDAKEAKVKKRPVTPDASHAAKT